MGSINERVRLHMASTILQCGNAGNHLLMGIALSVGVSKLVFLVYRTSIAFLFLSPFAFFLEKKDRPPLNPSLILQLFLLGLIGVVTVNGLYIIGLDHTSPLLVSSVENAIPAVTFLMAAIFRFEQVHLNRRDGIAKVVGTISCAAGASVISFYKGPAIYEPEFPPHQSISIHLGGDDEGKNWIFGCTCIIIRCLFYAGWTVYQASIVKKYPARISVTSFGFFFGLLQLLAITPFVEVDPQEWKIHSQSVLISLFYSGIVPSALGFSIIIWIVERGGPMLATAYMPLQTLLVAIMTSVFLHEEFYFGSIIGAALIMAGLYLVVWGQIQEADFKSRADMTLLVKDNDRANNP